jgi:hypothetical protein
LWIWLAALLAAVALVVVALEVTGQPWFCGTCHEMKPAYEGWVDSAHTANDDDPAADCMDCHADPGIVGYFEAHVVAGLRDVYVHFIAGPPEQVADSYVPNSRCFKCHDEQFDDEEFLDDHPTGRDEYCAECHRDEAHTNDRPDSESESDAE